ncbi:marine proteobacterial sortase target protein [Cohaesibacter intestini]|uniref:marine proteobacterial sortase target protein n=1 Tax=Cohaesibacter intestini TaxID=2211145 RepID=UPI001300B654|nr:marine proteobacterial sortase target protein [Cohaesibacter intestini]
MPLSSPDSQRKKRRRHSIDLDLKRGSEKSISKAFKIWIGAYALAIGIGFTVAAHPARSAPVTTPEITAAEQAPQARASSDLRLVGPNDMQSGGLLFKAKEPGKYVEAPKVATDIKLDVTGPVARATVTQTFLNPSDVWVEGIYVFPLPDNAAVDQLKMKVGDRLIEGKIKPKQEAREIYEAAKREGKKASLLEQQRPNLFTNAVANIGPGESITVQIEYQETIPRKGEDFSLRVPLVVAPRYNPLNKPLQPVIDMEAKQTAGTSGWGSTDPVPDRDTITAPVIDPNKEDKSNPVTLSVTLNSGFPLDKVVSHYHDVDIKPAGDDKVTLTLKEGAVPADKDFLLTWTGKKGKTPNLGLFTQKLTGKNETTQDYLLAYITPPYKLTESLKVPPREVIFVIDQSGSMAGPSIRQARASLIEALDQLKPEDSFQIIRFNNEMNQLFGAPQKADSETVAKAKRWVNRIKAEGGTEMLPAMLEALADSAPNAPTLRQVIFLTDGAIGNEKQLFEAVKSQKGRSRIFTVGIGSAPNSFFMSRAAEVGRGTFTHIGDITEVQSQMETLFKQLSSPVATDLTVTLAGSEGIEASPDALPDLYLGEPVILALKANKLGDTLTLKGRFDNQPWTLSVDLTKAAPSTAVNKIWARGKIRQLESDRLLSNDSKAIDKRIETLGLDHHLVTRLTSLVAVDVTPSRPSEEGLESKKVPLNLPDGWEMDKVFGEQAEMAQPVMAAPAKAMTGTSKKRMSMQMRDSSMRTSALIAPQAAPMVGASGQPMKLAAVQTNQGQIMLPKTATKADLILLTGTLLLLLSGGLLAWLQWRRVAKK